MLLLSSPAPHQLGPSIDQPSGGGTLYTGLFVFGGVWTASLKVGSHEGDRRIPLVLIVLYQATGVSTGRNIFSFNQ
jgi:hypothetical protein